MIQWEYEGAARKAVVVAGNGELVAGLDAYGADGWELVTIERVGSSGDYDTFIFKREVKK